MERCFFDADDIDRIVRNSTLAEIDQEIQKANFTAQDTTQAQSTRDFWGDRRDAFELARTVAEYCFINNIPTNEQVTPAKRELNLFQESRVLNLIRANAELQQQVVGLTKALTHHLATKQSGKSYNYSH